MRADLRNLPAPEPSPDLLERILRSRARGVRVTLRTRRVVPWRWLGTAAAVAFLVLGGVLVFIPKQTVVSQPKYRLVTADMLDLSRMTAGVWSYQSQTTTGDTLNQPSGGTRIRVTRATYAGKPAWMVNTAKRKSFTTWGNYGDTTYLDASSLRPVYFIAVSDRFRTRWRFVQEFSHDSGHESIEVSSPRFSSRRGDVAFPFPSNALFVNDWFIDQLLAVLPALPLSHGWHGSLYQVAFISQPDARKVAPLDIRVTGTERVTVPAGRFDCWRLAVDVRIWDVQPERFVVWVSQTNGWVVKTRTVESDRVLVRVLASYEDLPGN